MTQEGGAPGNVPITEIFASIQGEGPYAGKKQIFVRFAGCNMTCVWCDTPQGPSKGYGAAALMNEIDALEEASGPHHSVSLTGGEPLLYVEFLEGFLPLLKASGYRTYLETNGTLPDALRRIIDYVDIIAMDFKLPSSTLEKDYWRAHQEFLGLSRRKDVFVKAVLADSTSEDDIKKAISLIKSENSGAPFILQPAEPAGGIGQAISDERVYRFLEISKKSGLADVRVIPQIHKLMGVK